MSLSLIEKIKKARHSELKCGDFTFVIARPTELDLALNPKLGLGVRDFLSKYVVGWSGVKEIDLIPNGMPDEVEFSGALFLEWIEDKPDLWNPVVEAIRTSYTEHRARLELQAKN